MEHILEVFTSFCEPMIDRIGVVVGIFGIVLSVYFYYRSRRNAVPTFHFAARLLQSRVHPEVEITYQGRRVERMTQLFVVFWNAGNRELRASDIPKEDRPRVQFAKGATVLSSAVLAQSASATEFIHHQRGDHTVELDFAYLNPGDGAVVEVLFDSPVDDPQPYSFHGTLIGAPPVQSRRTGSRRHLRTVAVDLVFFAALLVFVAVVAVISVRSDELIMGGIWILATIGVLALWIHFIREWRRQQVPPFAEPHS